MRHHSITLSNTDVPKDFKPVYFCPVCLSMHRTEAGARLCAESTPEPVAKVGDVILMYPRYGWFDGDKRWVEKNTGVDHNGMPLLAFWYVITAIDHEEHRVRYHVDSRAIKSQRVGGYTFTDGHLWEWPNHGRKVPKAVLDEAPKMVGTKFNHLL
jgi:hypothetical protein